VELLLEEIAKAFETGLSEAAKPASEEVSSKHQVSNI
jgi:hypothetical protein